MYKLNFLLLIFLITNLLVINGSLSEVSAENINFMKEKLIKDSISNYPGKCACPYQLMSNGSRCGKRSAYLKPGGYSPFCYLSDISKNLINSIQSKKKTKKAKLIFPKLRIIDGDTIVLNSKKIRLHGIDTPETKQTCKDKNSKIYYCGLRATEELNNIIGNNKVTCKTKDKDRYGRLVSVCFVNGKDINATLVKNGWALAYIKYSKDYLSDENEAKNNNLGLWSGTFISPWEWRRQKK